MIIDQTKWFSEDTDRLPNDTTDWTISRNQSRNGGNQTEICIENDRHYRTNSAQLTLLLVNGQWANFISYFQLRSEPLLRLWPWRRRHYDNHPNGLTEKQ